MYWSYRGWHSEQEEQPVQVPDVMPNIAPRGRGRKAGQGSAPRRGMDDVQGDLQDNKLLYLLVSMFHILSGMIQKVMDIIDLSTYPSQV